MIRGQVVGFLNLYSDQPNFFTQTHAERLKVFASQSTTAIENARLYEQTRLLSFTDGLTGLYNSRHFFELAIPIFEQSRKNKSPLSIIMIDADFFKKINDQFGHQAGDTVICKISDLIRQTVRKGNICRSWRGGIYRPITSNHH